jgi:hypothetical protein
MLNKERMIMRIKKPQYWTGYDQIDIQYFTVCSIPVNQQEAYAFIRRYSAFKANIDLEEFSYDYSVEQMISNIDSGYSIIDFAEEFSIILNCNEDEKAMLALPFIFDAKNNIVSITIGEWIQVILNDWLHFYKGNVTNMSWKILEDMYYHKIRETKIKEVFIAVIFTLIFIILFFSLTIRI